MYYWKINKKFLIIFFFWDFIPHPSFSLDFFYSDRCLHSHIIRTLHVLTPEVQDPWHQNFYMIIYICRSSTPSKSFWWLCTIVFMILLFKISLTTLSRYACTRTHTHAWFHTRTDCTELLLLNKRVIQHRVFKSWTLFYTEGANSFMKSGRSSSSGKWHGRVQA